MLENPISRAKLRAYNAKINKEDYATFFEGNYYDHQMAGMNYGTLIYDLNQNVVEYRIKWRNGSEHSYINTTNPFLKPTNAISWLGMFYQCYELQVPHDKRIASFWFIMKSNAFEKRHHNYSMIAFLHNPNHLLLSGESIKYSWAQNSYTDDYIMRFRITSV